MLGVILAVKQFVDQLGTLVGGLVWRNSLMSPGARELAGQVDIDAANELLIGGLGGGLDAELFQLGLDEAVNFALNDLGGGILQPILGVEIADRQLRSLLLRLGLDRIGLHGGGHHHQRHPTEADVPPTPIPHGPSPSQRRNRPIPGYDNIPHKDSMMPMKKTLKSTDFKPRSQTPFGNEPTFSHGATRALSRKRADYSGIGRPIFRSSIFMSSHTSFFFAGLRCGSKNAG